MSMTRRTALAALSAGAATISGRRISAFAEDLGVTKGPFKASRESLATYQPPEWFRDAKFGIWAHWGPQSAIEAGDWYARNMYMQGSEQYKYHVAHYGHPSKFGYKDTIPAWKAEKFDPEYLMGLYKKAGAKYFFSMGVHHDNFDLWNSKHTRWNAVSMGPKKDIVGMWKKAATNHGLKFGVSEHLWITYKWFTTSHGSDKEGHMAGVPYDGTNPAYADLYTKDQQVYWKLPWNEDGITEAWKQHWYARISDLVNNYQPDLLYTDGALPFEQYGMSVVANLYNLSAAKHGKTQAVYNSKRPEDCATGTCVLDVERGVVDKIWPTAWQTDTCIGDWHYKRGIQYKSPKTVVDMLVDIVSRNGNLLLNFPLPASGMLDDRELEVLDGITKWMAVNSEGIYGTRPWHIYGEGPSTKSGAGTDAKFNEKNRAALTAEDVRFTTKGKTLYAFVMGWPEKQAVISALGTKAARAPKVEHVSLLGNGAQLKWQQAAQGLAIQVPQQKPPSDYAVAFKVATA